MVFKKKLRPAVVTAIGFLLLILTGACLLFLPISIRDGVRITFLDALFTATSAVCVTGLVTVDPFDTYTGFGQVIIALLIQAGGLGVSLIGVAFMLALRKRIGLNERLLLKESINIGSFEGILMLLKKIFKITIVIEFAGAVLSFISFSQRFPFWRSVQLSVFHAVSAFNNAGFDILGGMKSLTEFSDDVLLNLVTCALIFFGGIGFLVIHDLTSAVKFHTLKKLRFHTKVALSMSAVLIVGGTILLKVTGDLTWLESLFQSVSARTAGFATYNLASFTNAGLLVMITLMFIGASPGGTGGGIKTTTLFCAMSSTGEAAGLHPGTFFKYKISPITIIRSMQIITLAISVVIVGTFLLLHFDPEMSFEHLLFEVVSAFGTVGLSCSVTPELSNASRIVLIIIMYIGRVGVLTVATMLHPEDDNTYSYPEGYLSVG